MNRQPPNPGSAAPARVMGPTRYQLLDLTRGFAIVLMVAYHFAFDLNWFNVVRIRFAEEPFWIGFRLVIVSLFLLVMGMSLYVATRNGIRWPRFLRRLGLIALYAALVSIGSALMFPNSWIFFGILHFVALASVLGLAFRHLFVTNLVLGAGIIVLSVFWSHPLFDHPWLQWVGMTTRLPATEDWVPLVPWFGMVLIGLFLGRLLFRGEGEPGWLGVRFDHPAARLLALGGRHSLHVYMVHQPLMLGVLWVIFTLF